MSKTMYDVVKYAALVLLPAIGSSYFALSNLWGFPNTTQVVGTIMIAETFLGILVGLSARQYNKSDARFAGVAEVYESQDGQALGIDLRNGGADIPGQKEITLKVVDRTDRRNQSPY